MTKRRRTQEERSADLQKRDQFNAEVGAAVLAKIEDEGKSQRAGSVKAGEKLSLLYSPMYCEHVMERGLAGWSLNEIAIELRVHPATLKNWTYEFPEFAEAHQYAKKARLAFFERNYRGLSSGECTGSASITAAYCAKHDPAEYADPYKVVMDLSKEAKDGLDAIVAALSASPFSLATASPPIDVEFDVVD